MSFGEKLTELRTGKSWSKKDLAEKLGVGLKTIYRYESGESYPRNREIYYRLAELFNVDVNYLLTENEEFITDVGEKYGRRGQVQAEELLDQARQLFAGGTLSNADKAAFMTEMQMIFLDSKEIAKEKYTPKKYRNRTEEENSKG